MTKEHVSLKSAAEDKAVTSITKSLPTFMVDPRIIKVTEGFNGRPIDPDHVATMKKSWLAGKDRTPAFNPLPEMVLRMVDGGPVLVAGGHRLTAYLELIADGELIERVPCKEFKGDEKQAILFMLNENSGKGWEMSQLGAKYAVLVNMFGMSFAEVAADRGRSVQHVKDCIRLVEQPEDIRKAVSDGVISGSQAMKLVKAEGSVKAAETIKTARAAAPTTGVKAGKITQKVLDRAGRDVVDASAVATKACKDHLARMLESPSFTGAQKDAIRTTMKAIGGRLPDSVTAAAPIDYVGQFLNEQSASSHYMAGEAAKLLQRVRAGEVIPEVGSEQARLYGHMRWLEDMAAQRQHRVRARAAAWFLTMLGVTRNGQPGDDIAPPPTVLSMDRAVQMEMDSGGAERAENMCPEHADLIGWLRGRK